jgi:hypothetical protein
VTPTSPTRGDGRRPSCIPKERVKVVAAPVLMAPDAAGDGAITLTPVLDGRVVRALAIRCSCGRHLEVECVYPTDEPVQEEPAS